MKKRIVAMILNLLFEVSVCGLDDVFFFTCVSEVLCLYEAEECRRGANFARTCSPWTMDSDKARRQGPVRQQEM